MNLELRTVFRVQRFLRGQLIKDYGEFEARWVADRVAIRASEKHGRAGEYVMVEPVKKEVSVGP